jgi:hypothetical protein
MLTIRVSASIICRMVGMASFKRMLVVEKATRNLKGLEELPQTLVIECVFVG